MPVNNLTFTLNIQKYILLFISILSQPIHMKMMLILLGHWMGNNGDLIYSSLNYRFIRGLQIIKFGGNI